MNTLLSIIVIMGMFSQPYCRPQFADEEVDAEAEEICSKQSEDIIKSPTVETIFNMTELDFALNYPIGEDFAFEDRLFYLTEEAVRAYDSLVNNCKEQFPDMSAPGEKEKEAFLKDLEKHVQDTEEEIQKQQKNKV